MRKLLAIFMIGGMLAFVACSQGEKLLDSSKSDTRTELRK